MKKFLVLGMLLMSVSGLASTAQAEVTQTPELRFEIYGHTFLYPRDARFLTPLVKKHACVGALVSNGIADFKTQFPNNKKVTDPALKDAVVEYYIHYSKTPDGMKSSELGVDVFRPLAGQEFDPSVHEHVDNLAIQNGVEPSSDCVVNQYELTMALTRNDQRFNMKDDRQQTSSALVGGIHISGESVEFVQ